MIRGRVKNGDPTRQYNRLNYVIICGLLASAEFAGEPSALGSVAFVGLKAREFHVDHSSSLPADQTTPRRLARALWSSRNLCLFE